MKKAIVTGASGFIGRALVRELLAHDVEVTAVVRSPDKMARMQQEHNWGGGTTYCCLQLGGYSFFRRESP